MNVTMSGWAPTEAEIERRKHEREMEQANQRRRYPSAKKFTVKRLMSLLAELPPDAPVAVELDDDEGDTFYLPLGGAAMADDVEVGYSSRTSVRGKFVVIEANTLSE